MTLTFLFSIPVRLGCVKTSPFAHEIRNSLLDCTSASVWLSTEETKEGATSYSLLAYLNGYDSNSLEHFGSPIGDPTLLASLQVALYQYGHPYRIRYAVKAGSMGPHCIIFDAEALPLYEVPPEEVAP